MSRMIWVLLVTTTLAGAPAYAQGQMDHPMPMPETTRTAPEGLAPVDTPPPEATASNMPSMEGGAHAMGDMTGAYGLYAASREASGTSWQPDASMEMGRMTMRGPWMLMGHANLNGVYDLQGGPRGDEKAFVSGMIMGMARRDLTNGDTVQFRAMLSPDPFMGKSGYPLLLASGETANGVDHLVDRQHPHDLFMELSGSFTHNISGTDSVFVYAGLPGEPAFGPPAFMHRQSIMDSPEAPITHHWFDSTHITFGVLTGGWVHDNWKIEASRFTGREPDQNRYNIEEPSLDSTAVRLSWNPTPRLALQASWADLHSPEQLEPNVDEERWSASAIYTMPVGARGGWWSTTLAVAAKTPSDSTSRAAIALESAYHPVPEWTLFGRAEQVETDELLSPGPIARVSKASIGAIRDFPLRDNVTLGIGAIYSHDWVPSSLAASYGGNQDGAMAFVRLRIG
jgi:hypothetical protein